MNTAAGSNERRLEVFCGDGADIQEAEALAAHLGVPLITDIPDTEQAGLLLRMGADGLALTGGGLSLRADLTRMLPRLRPANLKQELLVKACKIKSCSVNKTVIDATAGLGEDSLLLAAAGFSVRLFESDPVIAALLRDALRRAGRLPELSDIVGRMCFAEADSLKMLPELPEAPAVVFLDPMFPERQKSALVKKKFQLLQQLERPCDDGEALLQAALAARPGRIVIKRPLKGPFLGGIRPGYSLAGKAIRYDCIVLPENMGS